MEYSVNLNKLYKELSKEIKGKILKDEPLKKHTYFKIGGPAQIFIEPENEDELKIVLKYINIYKINYFVIGNGTNLLVSDSGFNGVIIKIGEKFSYIKRNNDEVVVGSGTLLSVIAKFLANEGLGGFEFASGIPGYIGGAVYMNAGAYNGEMKDVIKKVKCMNSEGDIFEFTNEEMKFGYRNTYISNTDFIVLEAVLSLYCDDKEKIKEKIREFNEKRISKQPISMPSAGSTFKRPSNGYASKLIEDCGLKGLRYNGAMVSDKHSGFIVNCDNATCEDVLTLINIVTEAVYDKFGIMLEPEVKII